MSTLILVLPIKLPLNCFYNSAERERVFYFLRSTCGVVQAAFLEVGVLGCNITDPVKVNNYYDHFTALSSNIANEIDVLTQIPGDIRFEFQWKKIR